MQAKFLPGKLSLPAWLGEIAEDQVSVRIVRFALGVTIAVALAYGIEWPLAFLFPVLTAVMLSLPLPMPTLAGGLRNMLQSLLAFAIGLMFSLFFIQYPLAYILMLGLVLFHLYYYLNRGGSFWLTLMSMLAILILPDEYAGHFNTANVGEYRRGSGDWSGAGIYRHELVDHGHGLVFSSAGTGPQQGPIATEAGISTRFLGACREIRPQEHACNPAARQPVYYF
jgi:hypothetical protein